MFGLGMTSPIGATDSHACGASTRRESRGCAPGRQRGDGGRVHEQRQQRCRHGEPPPGAGAPARATSARTPRADQRDQLGAAGQEHRLARRRAPRGCRCSTSPGRGRRRPSRAGRTRRSSPPGSWCRRGARPSGTCAGRQLPAHVRLGSRGCTPCARGEPCSAQPVAAGEPGRLRKTQAPSTTRVLRAPSSGSVQSPCRAPVPTSRYCHVSRLSRRAACDPLLVVRVGEVGAQGAAAVVGPAGVDALAAAPEDARPARRSAR